MWLDLDDRVTVFGISTDRTFSRRAFADTEELAFTLLPDSDPVRRSVARSSVSGSSRPRCSLTPVGPTKTRI